MKSTQIVLSLILGAAALASTAGTAAAQCTVGYDDSFALGNMYSQARATFGTKTKFVNGVLAVCPDPTGDAWSTCWNYRQRCGVFPSGNTAYVNTWPWQPQHSHNHYGFSNTALNTSSCFCNPNDGAGSGFQYKPGGVCGSAGPSGCPAWASEPRDGVTAHDSSMWHLIWMEKGGDGIQHVFDMATIAVGPGSPIQLWYVDTNGQTFGWGNLGANTNWGVNIVNVTQVWVGTAAGFGAPATIAGHTATPKS